MKIPTRKVKIEPLTRKMVSKTSYRCRRSKVKRLTPHFCKIKFWTAKMKNFSRRSTKSMRTNTLTTYTLKCSKTHLKVLPIFTMERLRIQVLLSAFCYPRIKRMENRFRPSPPNSMFWNSTRSLSQVIRRRLRPSPRLAARTRALKGLSSSQIRVTSLWI